MAPCPPYSESFHANEGSFQDFEYIKIIETNIMDAYITGLYADYMKRMYNDI